MSAIHETNNLGDLLKYEAPNLYSREIATLAAGQKCLLGTVVGEETATSKLKIFNPEATDGTEHAIGVLANDTDATLIDRDDVLFIARHAIVASHALIWPEGITSTQKTHAVTELAQRGVLVRTAA